MPKPVLLTEGGNYHLRVTVPADLSAKARDTHVTLPIGDALRTTKIKTHVKVSLGTSNRTPWPPEPSPPGAQGT